jgi:hypothetical protein
MQVQFGSRAGIQLARGVIQQDFPIPFFLGHVGQTGAQSLVRPKQ